MSLRIKEHEPLAPYTTIKLGGPARYFVSVASAEELKEALQTATKNDWRTHILAGGSNTIFSDAGFNGLVIKINLKGTVWRDEEDAVMLTAVAGELWEPLAAEAVRRGLAGFECLAGIPGSVGATPVQNVGAYGQDVSQTIVGVDALDRQTLKRVTFTNAECDFSYRMSRFKGVDSDRYVIVAVTYRLPKNAAPTLKYQQVIERAGANPTLASVREIVLSLRKSKSMVLDQNDPHTRSCGSFFMNPTLAEADLERLGRWAREREVPPPPSFPAAPGFVTVPAAWLIEQAGWHKGFRRGGVGISANHPLALVNYGGTTAEVMALSHEIEGSVQELFDITLVREPVAVK